MENKKKIIILNKDTIDKLIEVSQIMLNNAIKKDIDYRPYKRIVNNYLKIKDIYDSENEIKKYLKRKLRIYYAIQKNKKEDFEIMIDNLLKQVISKKIKNVFKDENDYTCSNGVTYSFDEIKNNFINNLK